MFQRLSLNLVKSGAEVKTRLQPEQHTVLLAYLFPSQPSATFADGVSLDRSRAN